MNRELVIGGLTLLSAATLLALSRPAAAAPSPSVNPPIAPGTLIYVQPNDLTFVNPNTTFGPKPSIVPGQTRYFIVQVIGATPSPGGTVLGQMIGFVDAAGNQHTSPTDPEVQTFARAPNVTLPTAAVAGYATPVGATQQTSSAAPGPRVITITPSTPDGVIGANIGDVISVTGFAPGNFAVSKGLVTQTPIAPTPNVLTIVEPNDIYITWTGPQTPVSGGPVAPPNLVHHQVIVRSMPMM